jgi:hypothetical protein
VRGDLRGLLQLEPTLQLFALESRPLGLPWPSMCGPCTYLQQGLQPKGTIWDRMASIVKGTLPPHASRLMYLTAGIMDVFGSLSIADLPSPPKAPSAPVKACHITATLGSIKTLLSRVPCSASRHSRIPSPPLQTLVAVRLGVKEGCHCSSRLHLDPAKQKDGQELHPGRHLNANSGRVQKADGRSRLCDQRQRENRQLGYFPDWTASYCALSTLTELAAATSSATFTTKFSIE